LGILLDNGKNWYTHWSRVTLITTEDDVSHHRFAQRLLAACSTSTGTASGTSTPRSLSEVTSSSAHGTEFTVIEETDGASSEEWVWED
jgi:hypothetical protein